MGCAPLLPGTRITLRALQATALAAFVFVAFSHIVSSAYLGVNGNHAWRQADVYGHILGFTGGRGFAPLDTFIGGQFVLDIPIYQYLIAKAALLTGSDPLVASRYFNLLLWALAAFAGYRLCGILAATRNVAVGEAGIANATGGVAFVFLFALSPLILHYYSVPLPDTMAVTLCLASIALLLRAEGARDADGGGNGERRAWQTWRGTLQALPMLLTATVIKSPVAFIFVVFYAVFALVSGGPLARRGMWLMPLAACYWFSLPLPSLPSNCGLCS